MAAFHPNLHNKPAVFWLWNLPQNLALTGALVALLILRSRRANIALLALLIALFLVPYWEHGAIKEWIAQRWGHSA
jgi:hypothetical protein